MENLYAVCCGIDVHKKLIVACLRTGNTTEIRETGSSTSELLKLSEWLCENNCQAVAMESTGSYWKPVYNILEANDLNPMVVNAQHMRNVPGRKTDIKDAEWISDLLYHGLLTKSFIPDKDLRELRELVTYRKSLVKTLGAEKNRLQKVLEGANIKISGTITDINGKSGQALLDCIVNGVVFDSDTYDQMVKEKKISRRLKASKADLIRDMNGYPSKVQITLITELRKHILELEEHLARLDEDIDDAMNADQKEAVERIKAIPGIGDDSAKIIIGILGSDLSRFPKAGNLCSWAGLCPGNHESAGKRKTGRTNKGNATLRSTLVVCAHGASLAKNSYFSALYKRISSHRGKKRALVAVAHSILETIYYLLTRKTEYVDLGNDYFDNNDKSRKINTCVNRLKKLGIDIAEEVKAKSQSLLREPELELV